MIFYFDVCVSPRIVDALNSMVQPAQYQIVHTSRDMGWGKLSDVEWIGKLSPTEENFIVTKDLHQRTRESERNAWKQANAVMFFFPKMWIGDIGTEQAWKIMRWWKEIESTAMNSAKGVAYRIPYRAKPSRLHPWQD